LFKEDLSQFRSAENFIAAGEATFKGKTYFCSVSEKEQFEKEPAKYVK
jgi:YHS domain-containing protein